MWKTIVITGASSGIGESLALELSTPETTLLLCGRNEDRLNKVAEKCRNSGAKVETKIIDVNSASDMESWLNSSDEKYNGIDLVIANAGISGGTSPNDDGEKRVRDILTTNIAGVMNTFIPSAKLMIKRGGGQIALMSSMASFIPLPSAPAYSASKAAVRFFGESVRDELSDLGVKVNVICPGYVKTPMTDANKFPMPLLMSSEKAAKIIVKGLTKDKAQISFPAIMHLFLWVLGSIPGWILSPIFKMMPRKEKSYF